MECKELKTCLILVHLRYFRMSRRVVASFHAMALLVPKLEGKKHSPLLRFEENNTPPFL